MTLLFTDQVGGVEFLLVAAVLQNHQCHGSSHEQTEAHHRGRSTHTGVDQQGIQAQHHEDGEIFIEVLNGDGTTGAHQHVTAVLQQSVHRHNEEAGADTNDHHDRAGNHQCPRDQEVADADAACRNQVLVEVSSTRHQKTHHHAHGQHVQGLLKRNELGSQHSAHSNTDAHDGLQYGSAGEASISNVALSL